MLAILICGCTQSPPASPDAHANVILIKNFAFNPTSLTIKSDKFNSLNLNNGDSFEFTFNEKGTYEYGCGIHPSMRGTIIVE